MQETPSQSPLLCSVDHEHQCAAQHARGGVYSRADMQELFPACRTHVDKELGNLGEVNTHAHVVC